jgi:hypothetical protein
MICTFAAPALSVPQAPHILPYMRTLPALLRTWTPPRARGNAWRGAARCVDAPLRLALTLRASMFSPPLSPTTWAYVLNARAAITPPSRSTLLRLYPARCSAPPALCAGASPLAFMSLEHMSRPQMRDTLTTLYALLVPPPHVPALALFCARALGARRPSRLRSLLLHDVLHIARSHQRLPFNFHRFHVHAGPARCRTRPPLLSRLGSLTRWYSLYASPHGRTLRVPRRRMRSPHHPPSSLRHFRFRRRHLRPYYCILCVVLSSPTAAGGHLSALAVFAHIHTLRHTLGPACQPTLPPVTVLAHFPLSTHPAALAHVRPGMFLHTSWCSGGRSNMVQG